MRQSPPYDARAPKRSVTLTLNSDLYTRAKALGINVSRIAERAVSDEYSRLERERIKLEIADEMSALEAFEAKHGSCHELMREYLEALDNDIGAEPNP